MPGLATYCTSRKTVAELTFRKREKYSNGVNEVYSIPKIEVFKNAIILLGFLYIYSLHVPTRKFLQKPSFFGIFIVNNVILNNDNDNNNKSLYLKEPRTTVQVYICFIQYVVLHI